MSDFLCDRLGVGSANKELGAAHDVNLMGKRAVPGRLRKRAIPQGPKRFGSVNDHVVNHLVCKVKERANAVLMHGDE